MRREIGVELSRTLLSYFFFLFGALISIDVVSIFNGSPAAVPFKYIYLAIILGFIIFYAAKFRTLDTRSWGPLIVLSFFAVTLMMFFFNLLLLGQKTSYVSAFISALCLGIAAFIPAQAYHFDSKKITRLLLMLLVLGSTFYLIEVILKTIGLRLSSSFLFKFDVEQTRSIFCVLAISLSILMGRYRLVIFLSVITIIALLLRPTSALVLALAVCIPIAVALKLKLVKLVQIAAFTLLVGAAVSPFLLVFSPEFSKLVVETEALLKRDVLGGISNSEFRLYIIKEAFHELEQTSYIFGNGFTGDTNVFVGFRYPYWLGNVSSGLAAIHSDFVIMLNQSGLLGYGFFIVLFAALLQSRFRALKKLKGGGVYGYNILGVGIITVFLLILYASFNPFLQQYEVLHIIWMILFFSEMARKSLLNSD